MNKVILMGRLTRDAEVRYSQGRVPVRLQDLHWQLTVGSAGTMRIRQRISLVVLHLARQQSFLERFGRKGTKFVLEGHIQTGSYTNKDGQRVYTTDVVAENVEFAESKNAAGGNADFGGAPSAPSPSGAAGDGFMNIPDGIDEELPFN